MEYQSDNRRQDRLSRVFVQPIGTTRKRGRSWLWWSAAASYTCKSRVGRREEGLTVVKPNGIITGIISEAEVEDACTVGGSTLDIGR